MTHVTSGGVPGFSLRSATGQDAEQITRLYVDSWNQGFGDLMPRRSCDDELVARWAADLVADRSDWRVGVLADRLVGFAGTCPSRDPVVPALGELDTIVVDPSCWRRGVGRMLMADAANRMAQHGFTEAVLWTLVRYARGRAFYVSTGWRESDERRDDGRQLAFRRLLVSQQAS